MISIFVVKSASLGAPFVNLNLFKKGLIEKTQDFKILSLFKIKWWCGMEIVLY